MAKGVTPRPRRGALRKIPIDLPSTSSVELGKVLALHEQATQSRNVQPATVRANPASRSQVIAGGRTNSKMKLRGGAFGPAAKDNFR